MAKVSFTTLKLKVNDTSKCIQIGDKEIEVYQYIPAEDKYDLIMITLQQSKENGIYNSYKQEIFFHLNLVYMYTNLSFTDKQKEDYLKLYDILESNGIFDAVVDAMAEDEYENLLTWMEEVQRDLLTYENSFAGVVNGIMENLPKNAEAAAEIVNGFDPEKYEEVLNFAKGIGLR
jgi:hypothetical protein